MKILILFLIFLISMPCFSATLVKTIGATSRDYSTAALWEADLDDGTNAANDATAYQSGDIAQGECYDDAAFTAAIGAINGGGTVGLVSINFTAASGERHDGTAGSGVRFVGVNKCQIGDIKWVNVSWIEMDANGGSHSEAEAGLFHFQGTVGGTYAQCIAHDNAANGKSALLMVRVGGNGALQSFYNCIAYDATATTAAGSNSVYAIRLSNGATSRYAIGKNLTLANIKRTNGQADSHAFGLALQDDAECIANNVIAMDTNSVNGSSVDVSSISVGNGSYVVTEDATGADYSNGVGSKSYATQFVSTTNGSEDYHLVSGSDAIGAGVDNEAAGYTGEDIDGFDRHTDATYDPWDIGADEYTVAAATGRPQVIVMAMQ